MLAAGNFAIYYVGDAYTTANKIMGRQSAGKAFMRGLARSWPNSTLYGVGQGIGTAQAMLQQLQKDGFAGQLKWVEIPNWSALSEVGVLYFPAPISRDIAFSRNLSDPAGFSIMGVTHTLSSTSSMDQLAELVFSPFRSWDALICTSRCAQSLVQKLQEEFRIWWSEHAGATSFILPQLPVIPLGIDFPAFSPKPGDREEARASMQIRKDDVVFLFSGRLSFHAKANPAPMYQVLEQVARQVPVVCVEAGVFPNEAIRSEFQAAQRILAPSVRFVWVNGNDEKSFRQAWQGADVFVSLSDNIQETFGLTPVEAMAAGLPVVVSDWDGYKDTVRDGVDGLRVPTVLPPNGVGGDLAVRHALGVDTYDFYIGRTSMATVVEPAALLEACTRLATQPGLRSAMGAAGQKRAQAEFDWPVILQRYAQLASELTGIRNSSAPQTAESWPQRADPFHRFAHFPTQTLAGDWLVASRSDAQVRLRDLLGLSMANYVVDANLLPRETIEALLSTAREEQTVNTLLAAAGATTPAGVRCLMWLWKFDLVQIKRR